MKITVVSDVTPCSLVDIYRHFYHDDDDGSIFFRNVGKYLPYYTPSYSWVLPGYFSGGQPDLKEECK
jgi:hypothetical protein